MNFMRLRIIFSKTEGMRFTSHLDLYRTWERSLRRAGLPLLFSQGFNPRPRIQIAAALPLGFTSEYEVIDIWLTAEELPIAQIEEQLLRSLPPGLSISEIYPVDPDGPALQNTIRLAIYKIELLDPVPDIHKRVLAILTESSIPRERRGKVYDLRPLIVSLDIQPEEENHHQQIQMVLTAEEGKTGRPEEVLAVLDIPIERARIQRERLVFEGEISGHSW